jgi:hypothetical protein
MRNLELNIHMTFTETDESITNENCVERLGNGSLSIIFDAKYKSDIDYLEKRTLQLSYSTLRAVFTEHLRNVSKEYANEQIKLIHVDGIIVEHPNLYPVDGEIGRIEFQTFDVKSKEDKILFAGSDMFPALKGCEWYLTQGFKEVGVFLGAVNRSYRQTTEVINRVRQQELGDGTPLTTLCDKAHSEGKKVHDFIEIKTQKTFEEHHVNSEGVPDTECSVVKEFHEASYLEEKDLQGALTSVFAEIAKKGYAPEDYVTIQKTTIGNKNYENPKNTVNLHYDDIGVKKQKEHREKKSDTPMYEEYQPEKIKGTRPSVQNTVARIEHNGKGFTSTGRNISEVLKYVLAVLLCNNLLDNNLVIFTDGYKPLHAALVSFFSWHPKVTLYLDWFHVEKKFKEDLSLACKGREIRKNHLDQIMTMLWFGLIDKAKDYISAIPMSDIKNPAPLNRLIEYLERNRERIPCYAMRKRL